MDSYQLPRTGFLSRMEDEWLAQLTPFGVLSTFQNGQEIIGEGKPNDSLYAILEGKLAVQRMAGSKEINLAVLETGECFGEISVFEPAPASATVRALTTGWLWRLDAGQFQNFMDKYPYQGCILLLGINQLLSRRLRVSNETIRKHNIAPGFVSIRARLKTASNEKESSNA